VEEINHRSLEFKHEIGTVKNSLRMTWHTSMSYWKIKMFNTVFLIYNG